MARKARNLRLTCFAHTTCSQFFKKYPLKDRRKECHNINNPQWTRTKFGIIEIHHWSYIYCRQGGSYTSSEQLKMKLGTWGIKRNHIYDLGTFGGSNHPPKVTLVVWLVCHSNSKLAFQLLVTIICLSRLGCLLTYTAHFVVLCHVLFTSLFVAKYFSLGCLVTHTAHFIVKYC